MIQNLRIASLLGPAALQNYATVNNFIPKWSCGFDSFEFVSPNNATVNNFAQNLSCGCGSVELVFQNTTTVNTFTLKPSCGCGSVELVFPNHTTVNIFTLRSSCGLGFGYTRSPELEREPSCCMKLLTVAEKTCMRKLYKMRTTG